MFAMCCSVNRYIVMFLAIGNYFFMIDGLDNMVDRVKSENMTLDVQELMQKGKQQENTQFVKFPLTLRSIKTRGFYSKRQLFGEKQSTCLTVSKDISMLEVVE